MQDTTSSSKYVYYCTQCKMGAPLELEFCNWSSRYICRVCNPDGKGSAGTYEVCIADECRTIIPVNETMSHCAQCLVACCEQCLSVFDTSFGSVSFCTEECCDEYVRRHLEQRHLPPQGAVGEV